MTHPGTPASEPVSRYCFPDPETVYEDGIVAVGGDLAPGTLLAAYRAGIFPWSDGPITWWSPDPRAIILLDGLHVSRSLARTIRRGAFRVTVDTAFRQVIEGCAAARPGREETWISPAFLEAYTRLAEMGWCHSVECWQGDRLAGGVYGVAIGAWFGGESMFSAERDASKVAIAALVVRLRECGFVLFDAQVMNPHLATLGAVDIPRAEYLARLRVALAAETRPL
ncbi:MAG: leucyl/phenylalanyl-tRNA--protein transferase [Spirochaetes bacterium RBG_13_68_11]|nr:MAG: leucyl/phenylalanyl-tRNA--protein transferase [Spirochaetes bacterium RBG_13_68_11]